MRRLLMFTALLSTMMVLLSASSLYGQNYVDEIYGIPKAKAKPKVEQQPTQKATTQSYSNQSSVDIDEYYPGMIEESLTGSISDDDYYAQSDANYENPYSGESETESSESIQINVNHVWTPSWYAPTWVSIGPWYPSWYGSTWYDPYWGPSWSVSFRSPWYNPWYTPWYDPWYSPWYGYNPYYYGPHYGYRPYYGYRPHYGHHAHYRPKYNRHNSVYGGGRNPHMAGSHHSSGSNKYIAGPKYTRSTTSAQSSSSGSIARDIDRYNTRGQNSSVTSTRGQSMSSGSSNTREYSNPVRSSNSNRNSNFGTTRSSSPSTRSYSAPTRSYSSPSSAGSIRGGSTSGGIRRR